MHNRVKRQSAPGDRSLVTAVVSVLALLCLFALPADRNLVLPDPGAQIGQGDLDSASGGLAGDGEDKPAVTNGRAATAAAIRRDAVPLPVRPDYQPRFLSSQRARAPPAVQAMLTLNT